MPKQHTYSDTDSYAEFHSYADREPDAKSDSDAKGQANAAAPSYCARLKASYSSFGTQYEHTSENRIVAVKFYLYLGTDTHDSEWICWKPNGCHPIEHDRSWFIRSRMGLAKSLTTG